jgi:hypothetical protein
MQGGSPGGICSVRERETAAASAERVATSVGVRAKQKRLLVLGRNRHSGVHSPPDLLPACLPYSLDKRA